MAKISPVFVTGAKAVVKVYEKTLAFCSDVSYNVNVQHIPVESLGIFEIISNEPVSYTVDGTFSVIRYASNVDQVQDFTTAYGDVLSAANSASQIGNDTNSLKQHIDPAEILSSVTFDMEIMEKAAGVDGATRGTFFKLHSCRITRRSSSLNKRGLLVDNYAFVGIRAEDAPSSSGISDETEQTGTTPSGD